MELPEGRPVKYGDANYFDEEYYVTLADILQCPTQSLSASHYRDDGGCQHTRPMRNVVECDCGCGATAPDDGRIR